VAKVIARVWAWAWGFFSARAKRNTLQRLCGEGGGGGEGGWLKHQKSGLRDGMGVEEGATVKETDGVIEGDAPADRVCVADWDIEGVGVGEGVTVGENASSHQSCFKLLPMARAYASRHLSK